MKPRFWLNGLLLVGLALGLTGCVWTRLLSFKNQLSEFDRYVQVEDRDGLTLRFKQPVLYSQDVLFVMELEPTRRITNGASQAWYWTFRKIHSPTNTETGDFDLTFSTTFLSNKLVGFTLGERFLVSIPKPLLLGAMRSFGHAEVDQKRRQATMRWVDHGPDGEWQSLTRSSVATLLGEPYSVTASNEVSTCLYRYRLDSPSLKTNQAFQARVNFSFQDENERLKRVAATYGNFKIAYEPNQGKPAKP
jgi:hypothetical protein